jgi:glutamate:GABA antiporter
MSETKKSEIDKELQQAEAQVTAQSAGFKKELGLFDLTLAHILFMVGPQWFGTAGKLGQSHVFFWLLTLPLFFIPLVSVVIHLNRLMPLEGGLYQWAKLSFNEFIGFLVAWNLWFCIVMSVSQLGLYAGSFSAFALGPSAAWLAESKLFMVAASTLLISLLVVVAVYGLGVGKWLHNVSAVINLIIFITLLSMPLIGLYYGKINEYHPFTMTVPSLSLLNLNIFGKMAFGAFCGFEYMAIFAGECRKPVRDMALSAIFAAPLIALIYILGTSAVISFIKPDDIDLIGAIPQVFSIGFPASSFIKYLTPILVFSLFFSVIAVGNLSFNGNTRLPLVAGWDHLLPGWFTKLHKKHQTPVYSIIFVGAVTLIMAVISTIGVGQQEAFQLLQNSAGICYALAYLVMFAIPIIGLRKYQRSLPIWVRIMSLSGFLITLLYIVLSVFPIIEVSSWRLFAFKISAVVIAINIIGILVYLFGRSIQRKSTS